jgi:hypothetical protein
MVDSQVRLVTYRKLVVAETEGLLELVILSLSAAPACQVYMMVLETYSHRKAETAGHLYWEAGLLRPLLLPGLLG